MMKLMKYTIVLLFACLTGCSFSTTLLEPSLLNLRKGMTVEQVRLLLDDDGTIRSTGYNEPWNLTQKGLSGFGNIEVLIKNRFSPEGYQYFILAFQDNKLIYWGYPSDFY